LTFAYTRTTVVLNAIASVGTFVAAVTGHDASASVGGLSVLLVQGWAFLYARRHPEILEQSDDGAGSTER